MRVLLVGLGRMGQRYLTVLRDLYGQQLELFTVDPLIDGPKAGSHFKKIQDVPVVAFDLAIDAHPNEGRLELLQACIKRKIPKVILEKPHAASMQESMKMAALASKSSTRVMLPFYRFFLPEVQLKNLEKIDAGKLVAIHTISGAIGFGCNGVHLLDLASRLLGGDPTSIVAQLGIDTISSPRGPQFLDHDGTMILQYPKGKYIITVHGDSSVGINTTFVFQNGKIQLDELAGANWTWWRRPTEHLTLPMTRTSMEKEVSPAMNYSLNLEKLIHTGIKEFMSDGPVPVLADGHRTLKTIALAMASSKLNRTVHWSEDNLAVDTTFSFT